MHSEMKSKFFAFLTLTFLFVLPGVSIAQALDVPEINWERGRQQSITLGGETTNTLWKISLVGMGQNLEFERSTPNEDGFIVYSLEIPSDLTVGKYRVITSGPEIEGVTNAYINILETVSYDPLSDPKGVAVIAVIAFTLLSFFSTNSREDQESQSEENEQEDSSSLGSVDTNYQGIDIDSAGSGDFRKLGKSVIVRRLDEMRHYSVFAFSSRSPLLTRVASDGSYSQALIGAFSLVFPIVGATLGIWIALVSDVERSLVPTSLFLMLSIILLGVFDALAGLIAVITFSITATIIGGVTTVLDIRTLFGLALLWFTPALVAGATRPLRRARKDWDLWERLTDLLVSTLLTGWAIKGMVLALDGFAKERTEFATHSDLVALIGATAILVRYLLEEFTSRYTPIRLEYLTPPKLKSQDLDSFLISILVRVLLFIFFMYGFFGLSWQIFAATAILVVPSLLKRFDSKLPNLAWLWQIIPGGIPSIVMMSLIGFAFSNWVNTLPLLAADKTKTILILTSLPGLIVSLLKLFGRSAKNGDVRWYRRAKFKTLYRLGGPIMFALAAAITMGVLP